MRFLLLLVFIIVVEGVGMALGLSFPAGDWHAALQKPFFNPPNWIFGYVWPVLYLLVAIAGWRVFTLRIPGWGLWLGQLVLNWAWTPVFFGLHQMFLGIWIILGAFLLSLAFIATTWNRDKIAAFCFVPYTAWLGFALALNVAIWWLN